MPYRRTFDKGNLIYLNYGKNAFTFMRCSGGNLVCQASVYLDQEKILEDVIWLEPTPDGILVRTFFEGPQVIKGVLQGIDLLKHRVLLTSQQHDPEQKEDAS